jgi:hypothetical protein
VARYSPDHAFWKRAVAQGWDDSSLTSREFLIRKGEKVASAGSCFAANIVPFIEEAGFSYVRTEEFPNAFGPLSQDNFSYSKFSAAYGNIYTVRQAGQLIKRALGLFRPTEDRWILANDLVIDPFRPGLAYPASSEHEFDLLTAQHLTNVLNISGKQTYLFLRLVSRRRGFRPRTAQFILRAPERLQERLIPAAINFTISLRKK